MGNVFEVAVNCM